LFLRTYERFKFRLDCCVLAVSLLSYNVLFQMLAGRLNDLDYSKNLYTPSIAVGCSAKRSTRSESGRISRQSHGKPKAITIRCDGRKKEIETDRIGRQLSMMASWLSFGYKLTLSFNVLSYLFPVIVNQLVDVRMATTSSTTTSPRISHSNLRTII